MPDLSTPQGILTYVVAGGGSAVVVAVLFSAFGERWDFFQRQSPAAKALIQKAGSGAVAVLVYVLVTYLPPAWTQLAATLIGIAALGFGASLLNQSAHAVRKVNLLKPLAYIGNEDLGLTSDSVSASVARVTSEGDTNPPGGG